MFRKLIYFVFLFYSLNSSAQLYNNWIFLGSGLSGSEILILDFNNESINIFKKNNSDNSGFPSVICDSLGKVQLYSIHNRLYNSQNQIINNSDNLIVNILSGKNAMIIVPRVSFLNKYFIVQLNSYGGWQPDSKPKGLYLSEVNMSLNNGLGEVTYKNQLICKDSFSAITMCKDKVQGSFLIFTSKYPDSIFIFRIDSTGCRLLNKTRCIADNSPPRFMFSGKCLRISNDGKYLFVAEGTQNPEYRYIAEYRINYENYSLDEGKMLYYDHFYSYKGNFKIIDDLAIAPDNNILYAARSDTIIQIDRNNHKINYLTMYPSWVSDIKLGPDRQIYLFSRNIIQNDFSIHIIALPDSFDSKCNIKFNEFHFQDMAYISYYSFSLFENLLVKYQYSQECNNLVYFKNLCDTSIFKQFTWYFSRNDSFSGYQAYYSFPKSGKYIVKLVAKTPAGYERWSQDTIQYFKSPIAFFYSDTSIGCQWLKFKFYDASVRDTVHPVLGESWLWDFGDGTTDTVQNPAHIYTKTGKYTVKLIYSNGFCSDTIEKVQSVEIIEAPRPGFDMSKTNYCSPYELKITDRSIGRVQSYLYDFGDSAFSNLASPSHLYPQPGDYKVRQILTGPTGCVTEDSAMLHLRKGFDGSETINSLTTNVMDNKSILVNWQSYPEAFSYDLYRAMSETGGYTKAANLSDTFFNDLGAEPMKKVFSYKITGLDSCQRPGTESRPLKNIVLTGEAYGNEYSVLYWTPFEMWQNGVKEYVLEYRRSADTFEWINALNKNTYRDNDYFSGTKDFFKCYRIRAIEKDGNNQQSISNELCLEYEAVLWIPKAFTPNGDGLNDSFIITGIRIEDFNIKIYDRWGLLVYEGTDPEKGWNGSFNGKDAPVDAYYYFITAKGEGGKNIVLKGTMSLVR